MTEITRRNIYREAINAVDIGAVNASGLINSLAQWSPQIWDDVSNGRIEGPDGTRGYNHHPVVVLMVSQIAWLTGLTISDFSYINRARQLAETLAAEFEQETGE